MSRLVVPILAAALGMQSFGSGCSLEQAQPRRILYNPRVAIADRLLPGDKEVLVYKEASTPYVLHPTARPSYEQEIQSLRLGEIIALVRVASAQGELVEEGTWIRTHIIAQINQLVQSSLNKPLGDSVEFSFSGGSTRIGDVDVTAASFPILNPGDQYLVVLVTRPRIALSGFPLHVNADGVLEHVKMNTGVEASFQTNLIGRNISEVLEALTR